MSIFSKAKSAVKSIAEGVGGVISTGAKAVGGVVSTGAKAVGGLVSGDGGGKTSGSGGGVSSGGGGGRSSASSGGGGGVSVTIIDSGRGTGGISSNTPAGIAVGSASGGGVIRTDGKGGTYVDRTTSPSEAMRETGGGGRASGGMSRVDDTGMPIMSLVSGGVKTDTAKTISQQEAQGKLAHAAVEERFKQSQLQEQLNKQVEDRISRIGNFSSLPSYQQQKIINKEIDKFDRSVNKNYYDYQNLIAKARSTGFNSLSRNDLAKLYGQEFADYMKDNPGEKFSFDSATGNPVAVNSSYLKQSVKFDDYLKELGRVSREIPIEKTETVATDKWLAFISKKTGREISGLYKDVSYYVDPTTGKKINNVEEYLRKKNIPVPSQQEITPIEQRKLLGFGLTFKDTPTGKTTTRDLNTGETTTIYYNKKRQVVGTYYTDINGEPINTGGVIPVTPEDIISLSLGGRAITAGKGLLTAAGYAFSEPISQGLYQIRPEGRLAQFGFDVGTFALSKRVIPTAYAVELGKSAVSKPGETLVSLGEEITTRPEFLLTPGIGLKIRSLSTSLAGRIGLSRNYVLVQEGVVPDGSTYRYIEPKTPAGNKVKIILQEGSWAASEKMPVLEQIKLAAEGKGQKFYVHVSPELITTSDGKIVVDVDRGLYTSLDNVMEYKYNPSVLKNAGDIDVAKTSVSRIPKLNAQQKKIVDVVIRRGDVVGGSFAQKVLFPGARKFGDIDVISRDPHNTAIDIARELGPQHRVVKLSQPEGVYRVLNTRTGEHIDIAPTNLYRTNLVGDVPHLVAGGGLKVLSPEVLKEKAIKRVQTEYGRPEKLRKGAIDISILTGGKISPKKLLEKTRETNPQAYLYYAGAGLERPMGFLQYLVRRASGEKIKAQFGLTSSDRIGIQVIEGASVELPRWVKESFSNKLSKQALSQIQKYSRKFDRDYKPTTNYPTSDSWITSVTTGGGKKPISIKQIRIAKALIQWSRETKKPLVGGPELLPGLSPYGPEKQLVYPYKSKFAKQSSTFRERLYKVFGSERGSQFTILGGRPAEISFFGEAKVAVKETIKKQRIKNDAGIDRVNKFLIEERKVKEVSRREPRTQVRLPRISITLFGGRELKQRAARDRYSLTFAYDITGERPSNREIQPRISRQQLRQPQRGGRAIVRQQMRPRPTEYRLTPEIVRPPQVRPPRVIPPRVRAPKLKIRERPTPRRPTFELLPPKTPPPARRPFRFALVKYAKKKEIPKERGYILEPTITGVAYNLTPKRPKRLSEITGFEILR